MFLLYFLIVLLKLFLLLLLLLLITTITTTTTLTTPTIGNKLNIERKLFLHFNFMLKFITISLKPRTINK